MPSQVTITGQSLDNIDLEILSKFLFSNEDDMKLAFRTALQFTEEINIFSLNLHEDDMKPAVQTGLQYSEEINIFCLNLHCSANGQDTPKFDFDGFYANDIDVGREKSSLFKSFLDNWFDECNSSNLCHGTPSQNVQFARYDVNKTNVIDKNCYVDFPWNLGYVDEEDSWSKIFALHGYGLDTSVLRLRRLCYSYEGTLGECLQEFSIYFLNIGIKGRWLRVDWAQFEKLQRTNSIAEFHNSHFKQKLSYGNMTLYSLVDQFFKVSANISLMSTSIFSYEPRVVPQNVLRAESFLMSLCDKLISKQINPVLFLQIVTQFKLLDIYEQDAYDDVYRDDDNYYIQYVS